MENQNEYKGENFDTIEGAWDWHSRAVPETVYSPEELEYLLGEQIMFKKDFEEATTKLLYHLQPANNDYAVKCIEERIAELKADLKNYCTYEDQYLVIEGKIKELNLVIKKLTPNN